MNKGKCLEHKRVTVLLSVCAMMRGRTSHRSSNNRELKSPTCQPAERQPQSTNLCRQQTWTLAAPGRFILRKTLRASSKRWVRCVVFLWLICAFMQTCLFIGAPEMVVKMRKKVKPLMVIERKGNDLSYTLKTPNFTVTNSISIGKEAEITAIDGRKVKCTVREENGKLITESDKFTSVREIQGQEMIETVTAGSAILISRSRRV
ncbi:fatty acid-binding protein, liver-like isoform X1 [Nerophis lumbriciformis]|uniref:fatty acid-binding protein, liver-like isoform X1 n=1 Tax=Nerophis lumbriciformis TaxID=546530 RepID=UPI002ADF444D|nr:fatty acid-binding protein, liver-like isoform X1 [Nerophis lumbriciformis]